MLCVVKLDDPKIPGNGGVVQSVHSDSDFQQAHESTMRSALGGLRASDPTLRVWRASGGCFVGQRVRLPTQEELDRMMRRSA